MMVMMVNEWRWWSNIGDDGDILHFDDDDDDDFMAGSDGQYQLARITVLTTHAAHSLGYDDASDFDDEDQNVDDSDDDYIE